MKPEQLYLTLAKAIAEADENPPCQTTDPEAWFGDHGDWATTRAAKKLCATCPVINECATYAIAAFESHGIWGGLTAKERQQIRAGKRGRPKTT